MDANAALKEIREMIKDLDGADQSSQRYRGLVADFIGTVSGLDDSLSRGGFLPKEWQQKADADLLKLEGQVESARTNLALLERYFEQHPLGSVFVEEQLTFGMENVKRAQQLVDRMLSRAQNR